MLFASTVALVYENVVKLHWVKNTQSGARGIKKNKKIKKNQNIFVCIWLDDGNQQSFTTFTKLWENALSKCTIYLSLVNSSHGHLFNHSRVTVHPDSPPLQQSILTHSMGAYCGGWHHCPVTWLAIGQSLMCIVIWGGQMHPHTWKPCSMTATEQGLWC